MIKFTLIISEEQNKKIEEYRKKNFLDNRSQSIRHLIDSTLKGVDRNDSKEQ